MGFDQIDKIDEEEEPGPNKSIGGVNLKGHPQNLDDAIRR